jgi:hypothetical protein
MPAGEKGGLIKNGDARAVFRAELLAPKRWFRSTRGKIGNGRLAGDGDLPFTRQHACTFGQVNVDTGSETDHADALAGTKAFTLSREANNPARDQASDLNDGNALAGAGGDNECVSLVVLTRFVEIGADEFAGAIDDAFNAPGNRTAIDVAVEHAHEDRDARQRPFAKFELARRRYADDLTDAAIRRRYHDPLADRGYA